LRCVSGFSSALIFSFTSSNSFRFVVVLFFTRLINKITRFLDWFTWKTLTNLKYKNKLGHALNTFDSIADLESRVENSKVILRKNIPTSVKIRFRFLGEFTILTVKKSTTTYSKKYPKLVKYLWVLNFYLRWIPIVYYHIFTGHHMMSSHFGWKRIWVYF